MRVELVAYRVELVGVRVESFGDRVEFVMVRPPKIMELVDKGF